MARMAFLWLSRANSSCSCRLTPAFFAEVDDGARVTLTFQFWSGATVTYHVTKMGTSVTGTTG